MPAIASPGRLLSTNSGVRQLRAGSRRYGKALVNPGRVLPTASAALVQLPDATHAYGRPLLNRGKVLFKTTNRFFWR
jgi:hypothetical protein